MAVTILSVALLYLPVNRFFELEPLPWTYLAVLGVITLAYALASEAAKGWFFRREGAGAGVKADGPPHKANRPASCGRGG